jgi:rhamnosyltransferase
MKCSLVIRAYNEEAHIGRLLEGVQQQTVRDVEVILVDSGSTDRTVEIARQFGARVVHIRPQEFTFGRSLNLGLSAATRDLVVIASAHVYPVYPDWLERLLEPFADPARGTDLRQTARGAHPPNFPNTRFFNAGIRRSASPINPIRFATMPTPPSAAPFGKSIPTTKP